MKKWILVVASVATVGVAGGIAYVLKKRRDRRQGHESGSPAAIVQPGNIVDMEFEKFRKSLTPQDIIEFENAYGELGDLCMNHLNEESSQEIGEIIVSSIHLRNMLNAAKMKNNDDEVRKHSKMIIEGNSVVLEGAINDLTSGLRPDLQDRIKMLSNITMNYVIAGVARGQFLNPPTSMVQ